MVIVQHYLNVAIQSIVSIKPLLGFTSKEGNDRISEAFSAPVSLLHMIQIEDSVYSKDHYWAKNKNMLLLLKILKLLLYENAAISLGKSSFSARHINQSINKE